MQRYISAWLLLFALASSAHAVGFSATDSLATARRLHTAVALTTGKVLVAGGYNGSVLDSAESYDPATQLWTSAGAFTDARYWHALVALASGSALVIGGHGNTQFGVLNSVEMYDSTQSVQDAWSPSGSLGTARFYFTATVLLSGKVLVAGGVDSGGNVLNSAELYDPVLGQWTATTGSLNTARYQHTATLLASGKVLVVGGVDSSDSLLLKSAEVYDPVAGSWTTTSNALANARIHHAATLLPSGKVLVTGGYGGAFDYNYAPLAGTELYDPVQNSWLSVKSMTTARQDHTATLLPIGLVLVAGGYQGATALNSAELYDPVSNTWSNAGSLVTGRGSHTASLLPSGQVLIAGGATSAVSGGTALASAELYTADRIFANNFDGKQTKYP